jgi:hypothetical protein
MGDHIFAKITAVNAFGNSLTSPPGDGSAVVFVPDAPLNLANNPAVTSQTTAGLTWEVGVSNGGLVLLNYVVWYNQGTGVYI